MSSPPATVSPRLLGASSRYRHPGDVIRLISGTVLLGCFARGLGGVPVASRPGRALISALGHGLVRLVLRSAMPRERQGPRFNQARRRVNGESQRRATRDVEREMRADVDTGQPHQGNSGQGENAARRAEPGKGGDAKGDGDGGVPGQVPEPGSVPAAAAGPGKQRLSSIAC